MYCGWLLTSLLRPSTSRKKSETKLGFVLICLDTVSSLLFSSCL